MKKTMKKIAAFVLTAVLCIAMGITASAEGDDFSVSADKTGLLRVGDQVTVTFYSSVAADDPDTTYYVEDGNGERIDLVNGRAEKTYTVPESAAYEGYGLSYSLYFVDTETGEGISAGLWDDVYFEVERAAEIVDVTLDADAIKPGTAYPFSVTVKNNMAATLTDLKVDCCAPWVVERYEYELNYTSPNTVSVGAGETATVTGTIKVLPGTQASAIQFMARIYKGEYQIDTVEKSVNLMKETVTTDPKTDGTEGTVSDKKTDSKTNTSDKKTTTAKAKVKDSVPKTGQEAFPVWMLAVAACGVAGMILTSRKRSAR